ncbi:MAG: hypothetical protein HY513_03890 [Candidatus Aenigmarchaeota archaeon]|nr:hypothetical protein [Candidatus Aenigmarchaeota archaeon]
MLQNFDSHVAYVIAAHRDHPKEPRNAYRRWDLATPYSAHPIWCATTILTETSLPQDLREEGALALLYHDVTEDTTTELPEDLPSIVLEDVNDMTFETSAAELTQLWTRKPKIRLFKVYDKVSNWLDSIWMQERGSAYIDERKAFALRLVEDAERNYGTLNVVKIGRAVLV